MKRKVSKRLLLRLEGSNLSTGTLNNKNYVVCPCVALVGNNVIWASDSPSPEYVPVDTLKASVDSWNFRPVVLTHPANEDGEYYPTANTPEVLESFWFGYVFNSRVTKGKLFFDLWLDEERAETVKASNVIARLRSGDVVEVSIGCDVLVEEEEGEVDGQSYSGVWKYIAPDHLATLPEDVGACSIEMGCGAGRRAKKRNDGYKGGNNVSWRKKTSINRVLKFARKKLNDQTALRVLETFDPSTTPSYMDLYRQLNKALRKIVPQFGYVYDFWENEGIVVYTVYDDDNYYNAKYFRRGYKVRKGSITLGDDVTAVELVSMFKDKVASENRVAKKGGKTPTLRGINQSKQATKYIDVKTVNVKPVKAESTPPCSCHKKGKAMEKKKVKATVKKRVASSPKPKLSKARADQKRLEALIKEHGEEKLLRMLEGVESKEGRVPREMKKTGLKKKTTTSPSNVRSLKEPTMEEWLRSAPKEARLMFKRHQNLEATYRGKLITALLKDQSIYKQKQLEKMDTAKLEEIHKLARDMKGGEVIDFAARGLAVNYGDAEVDEYEEGDIEAAEAEDPLEGMIGKKG